MLKTFEMNHEGGNGKKQEASRPLGEQRVLVVDVRYGLDTIEQAAKDVAQKLHAALNVATQRLTERRMKLELMAAQTIDEFTVEYKRALTEAVQEVHARIGSLDHHQHDNEKEHVGSGPRAANS